MATATGTLTFGSLFAGIGGMDLGLERAGLECRWQVEIDDYARRVLAKHWPDVRRHDDVRTFPPGDDPESWRVDVIAGGFPCQDISYAGKGAGLQGERSGLWFEFARVVRVLRPRFVLVENVSALLVRGLDAVLGTLASDGYDAEWACIPAAAVGAPHIRDRVFLLAYARGDGLETSGRVEATRRNPERCRQIGPGLGAVPVLRRLPLHDPRNARPRLPMPSGGGLASEPLCQSSIWATEPGMGRVAHGVPARVDRLRGLGNAVVPQVAEWIGRRLIESLAV